MLFRSVLSINICACYHPPEPIYDVPSFKQHLAHSISLLIDNDSDAIFILTGDLNRLNASALQTDLGLVQIVNIPTHNNNIFDQFITNSPDQFVVQVAQLLVKTKHEALIVNSRADCVKVVSRPQRTKITVLVSWTIHRWYLACCVKRSEIITGDDYGSHNMSQ